MTVSAGRGRFWWLPGVVLCVAMGRAALGQAASEAQARSAVPVRVPETPAGKTMQAWLAVLNSGDAGLAQQYVTTVDPTETADDLIAFHGETGGFEVVSVESSEPLHLRLLLKEKDSAGTVFANLVVKDGQPPTVASFGLRLLPPGVKPVNVTLNAGLRERVLAGVKSDLTRSYIDLPVAERMDAALVAHQHAGEYDAITDPDVFADRLTKDLRGVSHDRHLAVEFSPFAQPGEQAKPSAADLARDREAMLRGNCAFTDVRLLANNIGYLKFDAFMNPEVCAPTASAAMAFVANSSALIIDLRGNGGGNPAMVSYIASYLFDQPTHLNDLYYRKDDSTRQFWTLPAVPGERLTTQPVYVLTSKNTFSGAEEFSYDLQTQKRATIVGETTGGGAHPMHGYTVAEYFTVLVPEGRPINPVTHTDWEGKGVVPEVKVAAADALATAQKLATEKIQGK